MADEVSGNSIAEFRKRGAFGSFSEDRMQSVLEGMWNKVDFSLRDSRKMTGQLEECYDSKVMQSVLNGRTFKYHFGEGGFVCFLSPINFLTYFVWIISFKFD